MKARILNDKICFSEHTYSLSSPSMSDSACSHHLSKY
jgi:hypothetical protein